jgi:hypothetical protein
MFAYMLVFILPLIAIFVVAKVIDEKRPGDERRGRPKHVIVCAAVATLAALL